MVPDESRPASKGAHDMTDTDREKAATICRISGLGHDPERCLKCAAICEALRDARKAGRAEGQERAAKVAESWTGRRLDGPCDDPAIASAFGRGVDMASYYIAADIRKGA